MRELVKIGTAVDVGLDHGDVRGNTPLMVAALRGNDTVMPDMLEGHSATRSLRNNDGAALHCAWPPYRFHLSTPRGIPPGRTALMLACEEAQYDAADALLSMCGVGMGTLNDLFAVDRNGRSPLAIAAAAGHADLVKLLIDKVIAPRSHSWHTSRASPCHLVAISPQSQVSEIVIPEDGYGKSHGTPADGPTDDADGDRLAREARAIVRSHSEEDTQARRDDGVIQPRWRRHSILITP